MPTSPQDCVNYEINLQMCPCTSETCANRGICCECIQAHYSGRSLTACMRGVHRKTDTMALNQAAATACALNQARNSEFCVCSYDECGRRGICCSCVRNHFAPDGAGRTACMKALG